MMVEVMVVVEVVVVVFFLIFCRCRGFCHRTESDLFHFLLQKRIFYLERIPVLIHHIIRNKGILSLICYERRSEFSWSGSNKVKSLKCRKYDPVIIERTIGYVPFTTLLRCFQECCTLTNKAIYTIWLLLSKSSQIRQGHDTRPFWLLVWNPSALGLSSNTVWSEHSLLWRMSLDILYARLQTGRIMGW